MPKPVGAASLVFFMCSSNRRCSLLHDGMNRGLAPHQRKRRTVPQIQRECPLCSLTTCSGLCRASQRLLCMGLPRWNSSGLVGLGLACPSCSAMRRLFALAVWKLFPLYLLYRAFAYGGGQHKFEMQCCSIAFPCVAPRGLDSVFDMCAGWDRF